MANNCLTNVSKLGLSCLYVCLFCVYTSPTLICRISSLGSGASPVPNGWVRFMMIVVMVGGEEELPCFTILLSSTGAWKQSYHRMSMTILWVFTNLQLEIGSWLGLSDFPKVTTLRDCRVRIVTQSVLLTSIGQHRLQGTWHLLFVL